MNKLPALFAVSLFIIGIAGACQKEVSDQPLSGANTEDSLLKKILVWDSLAPREDIALVEFMYDDRNRVTERRITYFDSTNGGIDILEQYSSYFYYNGTEWTPYRSFDWVQEFSTDLEIYHFYDAAGRLVRDSMPSPVDPSFGVRTYDYHPDKLIVVTSTHGGQGNSTFHSTDSFVIAGNNISEAYFDFPPGSFYWDAFECTYDNKINPLSKMNIAAVKVVQGDHAFEKLINLAPGYSRNNIVKRVDYRDVPPVPNHPKLFHFTYNDLGLPVYCIYDGVGSAQEIRIRYEYTV